MIENKDTKIIIVVINIEEINFLHSLINLNITFHTPMNNLLKMVY